MRAILALAGKDLRLLSRNRGHLFFTLLWPLLVAVFFGFLFGGRGSGRMRLVVVDEDSTPASTALVERLRRTEGLEVEARPLPEATVLVRKGKRPGYVRIPKGYGERSERLFWGTPPTLEVATDPSRQAEAAMLEGLLTGAAMQGLQSLFGDPTRVQGMLDRALTDIDAGAAGPDAASSPSPDREKTRRFLGDLRSAFRNLPSPSPASPAVAGATAPSPGPSPSPTAGAWRPVVIESKPIAVAREGPRSGFEVTFPQGVLWGVIGCTVAFALSLVTERTRGTLVRLRVAPLSRAQILAGKALACFLTILALEALLFALGRAAFGVRPQSPALLLLACLCVAVCFVGLMMAVTVLGRTEQTVGGLAWALALPLAMFGGGMVPLFVMPAWMQPLSHLSPVRWAILALEGALWRGFTPAEMLGPCALLVAVGVLAFALGERLFARE